MLNKKIIFIIMLTLFFFQGEIALAEVVGLSAGQSIFSFSMEPGKQEKFSVNIQNISDYAEKVNINSNDFIFGENSKIANLVQENEASGMNGWISMEEQSNMELGPKEKKELKFVISVPENASIGSHYALVLINAIPKTEEEILKSTSVNGRIGIYVLINVSGETSGRGILKNFEVPFLIWKNTTMKMEFENQGNIHYIPHGEVQIKNLFTKNSQKMEVEKHFVFPGKKYLFELNLNNASLFGIYQAQAIFVDGDKSVHVLERMFMGQLLLAIIVILVVAIILAVIFRKKIEKFLKPWVRKYRKKFFSKK